MRNKGLSYNERKINRVTLWFCGTLFVVFSFCYLAFFQNGMLGTAQDLLSGRKTQYNPYIVSLIITFLLVLVRVLFNRLAKLRCYWEAFSYLPSCLLLAFVTDFDYTFFHSSFSFFWLWTFSTGAVVCLVVIWLSRQVLSPILKSFRSSVLDTLWRNMLVMSLLFTMTGFLSNTDELFHYELAVSRELYNGRAQNAAEVGRNALISSPELTALRAVALSQNGKLGECLFEYPQYYGVEALLLPRIGESRTAFSADDLTAYFGVRPYATEKALSFFTRILPMADSLTFLKDYYLCALLLDKQLERFSVECSRLYPQTAELPKHYREALLLKERLTESGSAEEDSIGKRGNAGTDTDSMTEALDRFWEGHKAANESENVRSNRLRRQFGKTYWWYYLYGDVQ